MPLIGNPFIDATAQIAGSAIIGKPYRPLQTRAPYEYENAETRIGAHVSIGEYVIVGKGCQLSEHTILDDFTKLDPNVHVGRRCLLIYSAQICPNVRIGDDCIIGGFVGDNTSIGKNCRVFGKIVHRQDDPARGWDEESAQENAASICDSSFVGFQALVIGGVTIGPRSYVCAGAIVTKDVPPRTVVKAVNIQVPLDEWTSTLKESAFFRA